MVKCGRQGHVPSSGVRVRHPVDVVLGGCRLREIGLWKSFVEGQHDRCDVSTANGPFVVLLSQDGANEAAHGRPVREDAHYRISLLRRSCGLLDHIFFQWASGKLEKARTSGPASSIHGPQGIGRLIEPKTQKGPGGDRRYGPPDPFELLATDPEPGPIAAILL